MNTPTAILREPDCRSCALRCDNDWGGLEGMPAERINELKVNRIVASGETLFHQGDRNEAVYTVSKGLFALRILHPNGAEAIVGLGRPGQILGARSFLGNRPHLTTAQALVTSEVCLIRRKDVVRLTREEPGTHMSLVDCCIKSLDSAQNTMLQMTALGARERFSCLLLELCRAEAGAPRPGPVALVLPLSRQDMANMLGVTPESISRILSQMRGEGLIKASGRRVTIPDYARLAAASPPLHGACASRRPGNF